ncbi:MAG: discoidin domain-containing protein, partial [Bacteroidaceae bacterium]|nr:discoidin domain-containing protein [Bacteroidaceae bacterium]
ITLSWDEEQTVRYVELMEYIAKGQRVKKFHIETSEDGQKWTRRASNVETTTVGYKRIIPLNGSTSNSFGTGFKAKGVRIVIEDSKACPLISKVSVY